MAMGRATISLGLVFLLSGGPGAGPAYGRGEPDFTDSATGMEFVCLEGGGYEAFALPERTVPVPWLTRLSYWLGRAVPPDDSEQPEPRMVRVEDFCIGRYEVTVNQWHAVMGGTPPTAGLGDHPITEVSWRRVREFIEKLNGLTGRAYRLPSSTEWEFAARGRGDRSTWAGTSDPDELYDFAWLDRNSGFVTHPVGQKRGNSVGLYDMTGNAEEWCGDVLLVQVSPPAHGRWSEPGPGRRDYIVRGGSYMSSAEGAQVRLEKRSYFADGGDELTGFRLAY